MKKPIVLSTKTHPVVSLFLKWYLCRETLLKSKSIGTLLKQMDRHQVPDQRIWIELLRRRLLFGGISTLSSMLDRPLDQYEVVHLYERVEEFIELYSIGVRT